jgi:hypothetical protein
MTGLTPTVSRGFFRHCEPHCRNLQKAWTNLFATIVALANQNTILAHLVKMLQ